MSELLCIEVDRASALGLGLLGLWKDIHHNNRKAHQMPRSRVSFLLPDDVAYRSKHC